MNSPTGIYYLSEENLIHSTWASLWISDMHACSILQKDIIDFDLTSNSYIGITTRNTQTKDGVNISYIKSRIFYRRLTVIGTISSQLTCTAIWHSNASILHERHIRRLCEDKSGEKQEMRKWWHMLYEVFRSYKEIHSIHGNREISPGSLSCHRLA